MGTKVCSKCSRKLDLNMFSSKKANKDGYRDQCKECISISNRQYRKDNKETIVEYSKQYYKENKETIAEYSKQYRKENKEAIAEYEKEYRKDNKEAIAEYRKENAENQKEYRKENKEAIAEKKKIYYEDNKEAIAEYHKKYKKDNKEKYHIYEHTRNARKTQLIATLTSIQWINIKQIFNNKCCYCGKELSLTQDHLLALSKGGEYTHNNIIPACGRCNSSKGSKNFFEWYPKYKYYSKNREKKILGFLGYKNEKVQQTKLG